LAVDPVFVDGEEGAIRPTSRARLRTLG